MTYTPEERAYYRGYHGGVTAVLTMLATGCGDPDCGCDPRVTDCCEEPRWTCQTRWLFDGAGEKDVLVCEHGKGCHEENAA